MDSAEAGLWMAVGDVFQIRGRGTVATGQLQGSGQLSVGDTLEYDGMRWPINGIEQFGAALKTVLPGSNIGVLLGNGPPAVVLRGKMVQFEVKNPQNLQTPAQQDVWVPIAPRKKRRWRG
jgi:translation elongation factor EF-Tu-like GTPase